MAYLSKPKYGNKKVVIGKEVFDSQKEAKRWSELKLMEKAGVISDLERQVKFELIPSQRINGKVVERSCSYVADFVYTEGGEKVVEDIKGYKGGGAYVVFSLKRKLMLYIHGIRVREV